MKASNEHNDGNGGIFCISANCFGRVKSSLAIPHKVEAQVCIQQSDTGMVKIVLDDVCWG